MPVQKSLNKAAVLSVITTASFMTPFMVSAVNIALPSISKEFGMNAVYLSWIPTAYLLTAAIFLVPFGRLADIWGRKKIFIIGVPIYTISALLLTMARSAHMLIAFRVIEGIGAAMLFGSGTAILTSVFPPQERGRALGINVAGVYLGLSLGPVIGGFMTQHLGWRSIFIINIPIGIFIFGLALWKMKGEWAEARGEPFDYPGALLYGAVLLFLMYGFSLLPGNIAFYLIAASVLFLILLTIWETKIENPLIDIFILKTNKAFFFSNLAALINYSTTSAVGFLLSLYLQYIKNLTPQKAGLVMIFQPVVMTIFSPLAGRISDKIEPRIVSSVGMGLSTLGLLVLFSLSANTSYLLIIFSLLVLGLGFAFFSSPNTNAIMSSVKPRYYGVASGTMGTMRLVGQMLSMGVAMLIFALVIGRVRITPEYYGSFLKSIKVLFAIFTAFCFGGIFASLARGKVRG